MNTDEVFRCSACGRELVGVSYRPGDDGKLKHGENALVLCPCGQIHIFQTVTKSIRAITHDELEEVRRDKNLSALLKKAMKELRLN